MRLPPFFAVVIVLLGRGLHADEPQPIELTLHPRAIESPVLEHRLFPAENEWKPGNAVPILLRLPWEQTPWMTNVFPTLQEWESRSLSAPEWASSHGVLPENFYNEMKRAAFRREAVWEYPIQETQTPYLILLPDVQGLRSFLGYGLSARIRYHLSRGELDKAREGILVGLSNGRHLAQTPFYVNQLVAIAIHKTMLRRTDELIAQPDSPNLYWALSTLPDSLIEFGRTASLEGNVFAITFPAVNDLDRPRDAREWSRMADQLVKLLQELGELPRPEPPKENPSLLKQFLQRLTPAERTHIAKWAKEARAELPELDNIPQEKVEAMSDDEAAVRWYVQKRVARDQRTSAVLLLPPREAWPQLKRLLEERKRLSEQTGASDLSYFSPVSLYISVWSLHRKIQALRIVEAVRHHLATHAGALPASLDAIDETPIPLDPLTDRPFLWTVEGETATLQAPPLPAEVVEPGSEIARSHALEYRLRVK